MERGSANGVAVEGAGRSILLGAEVEQRSRDRALERQTEREQRQRPSSGGGAYYNNIYTHV